MGKKRGRHCRSRRYHRTQPASPHCHRPRGVLQPPAAAVSAPTARCTPHCAHSGVLLHPNLSIAACAGSTHVNYANPRVPPTASTLLPVASSP